MAAEKIVQIDSSTEVGKISTITVANVDNEFIGVSLTEHSGLEMRRIAAEIHDIRNVVRIRDLLNAFLAMNNHKEAR